jgi:hypothetical protein
MAELFGLNYTVNNVCKWEKAGDPFGLLNHRPPPLQLHVVME